MTKKSKNSRISVKIAVVTFLLFFLGCSPITKVEDNTLYSGFTNPPADARPFVRWWWNGNCLEKDEIIRQLTVLQKAGIGGVEINPIAMPEMA